MQTTKSLRLAIVGLICASAVLAHAVDMQIGDAAPQLKYSRWLKGTPVPKFEKGKVYVLEFWATWCGPCRAAMPHLSELAKRFDGKVTFIGVNIWEGQHAEPGKNLDAVVDKFMKTNGGDMAYNICAVSKDGYMEKSWMAAAGQNGIPATFVVDQNSKIAWIGHPVYLDEPLTKIIDGTFDGKAFAAEFAKRQEVARAQQKKYEEMMAPINAAMKAKNYNAVVEKCDKAIAKDPVMTMAYAIPKCEALMVMDSEKAYAEALKVQEDRDQSYIFCTSFINKDGLDKKYYRYSLEVALDQIKKYPDLMGRLSLAAKAYSRLGNPAKAVEYQQLYVVAAKKAGAGAVILRELEKELQQYKDAAAKGS